MAPIRISRQCSLGDRISSDGLYYWNIQIFFFLNRRSNVLHDAEHLNSRLTQALFFVTPSEG